MPRKPRTPTPPTTPRYRAYKPVKMTDGVQTWTEHRFDMTQPFTADDLAALRKTRETGSPRQRIRDMQERLAALEANSDPAIRLRVAAIRALHARLSSASRGGAFGRADLDLLRAADNLWLEIMVLRDLVPRAKKHEAFTRGRPKGSVGPMRAVVRAVLARDGNTGRTARELWAVCKALPERQRRHIDFESDTNAYVERQGNVSFRRFANIVSEEKKNRRQ